MGEPVLASKTYTEKGETYRLHAQGGVHYLKGNTKPYFSFTADQRRRVRGGWTDDVGGCAHELLLKHFPQFTDLAALHLSDIDGVPMHANANGWYNLAGAFPDAFGERYHAGNSDRHFPADAPPGKPWQTTVYRKPTGDECVAIFAEHVRVTLAEAMRIRDAVGDAARKVRHSRNAVARACLADIMATMRPRWKTEADACIAKHGLVVYGDPWPKAD